MGATVNGLSFPVEFPVSFDSQEGSITFPLTFPMSFTTQEGSVSFPLTFPMTFSRGAKSTVKIPIKCTAFLGTYHGTVKIQFNEVPTGINKKIPFKEKAWWFPGLFLTENVIDTMHKEINVTENVQSLILANFELINSNEVKVSWYGDTVPNVVIMQKPESDETYKNAGTYAWSVGEGTIQLTNEDYNIYLLGTSNSGSSPIYTIGGSVDALVIPDVDVTLNEKIYDLELDNQGVYHLTIEY